LLIDEQINHGDASLPEYGRWTTGIATEFKAFTRKHSFYLRISIILLSFAIPFAVLFGLNPQSFNATWKGRTFYLFFLWLVFLELILLEKPERRSINESKVRHVNNKRRGNQLIVLGSIFLFLTAYCFNLASQAGLSANVIGIWVLSLTILVISLGFITIGLYTRGLSLSTSARRLVLGVTLCLPAVYVVAVNFFGQAANVARLVDLFGIPFAPVQRQGWIYSSWSLSLEYLVFTILFATIIWVAFGRNGLKNFSISLLFIGAVGTVYMLDTLYPYGYFTPFQSFVPFTASLAAGLLNSMGFQTAFMSPSLSTPVLALYDSSGSFITAYGVGWPCAGVQSLLIYTCVMLIFFKKTTISILQKGLYFIIGALITYAVNILRITSIYLAYVNSLDQGVEAATQAALRFHDYYGGLYSMTWIVTYPLIIIGVSLLWTRIKTRLTNSNSSRQLE